MDDTSKVGHNQPDQLKSISDGSAPASRQDGQHQTSIKAGQHQTTNNRQSEGKAKAKRQQRQGKP